ncbi:shikimate transporter [Chlamydia trachomatis]|nr:shikimate transporter [Chlamydia trachomatis]
MGLGILWPPIAATIGTMFTEMFSTNVGYTGITLGYQTGSALFGGTAPMIATILVGAYNNSWIPLASFLVFLCIASLISVLFVRNSQSESNPFSEKRTLDDKDTDNQISG